MINLLSHIGYTSSKIIKYEHILIYEYIHVMNTKITLDDHIKWQMDHAFKGFSDNVDIEGFKKQFKGIPNEACHLLNCQNLEVYLVKNNFSEVLGVDDFHPKIAMDVLYLIHEDHMQSTLDFMGAVLANEWLFECGKDSVSQVFKLRNGKMILKTSTPLQMDSNRHVILVSEQFKDVTNLVGPGFKWSFTGPNADKIEQLVNNLFKKETPLTFQEITILSHIGKGYSSKEAAEVLFLSKHTVDTHRRNILKKLEVNNTSEALKQMIDMGVLS